MATPTVTIYPDRIGYTPDPLVVVHGEQVTFELKDRTDTVSVLFTDGSPFNQDSFTLDGSIQQDSLKTQTVTLTAALKSYSFIVVPPERKQGEDAEPPGSLGGDLEVGTDVPPEDDVK